MFQEFTIELPNINNKEYYITDYGAVSGGVVSNTKAFSTTVERASETGGRVVVPDGIWLTGPIELKSGVELHLEDNAVIVFDKTPFYGTKGGQLGDTGTIKGDNVSAEVLKTEISGNGNIIHRVRIISGDIVEGDILEAYTMVEIPR